MENIFLNIFFFYYYMVSVISMFNGFTFKTSKQTNFEWGLNSSECVLLLQKTQLCSKHSHW